MRGSLAQNKYPLSLDEEEGGTAETATYLVVDAGHREAGAELLDFFADFGLDGGVSSVADHAHKPLGDELHLVRSEAAGGHRRRADANTARRPG